MTSHTATKQRFHVPLSLSTAQPWVRDHYSALRAEAIPRWEHTKTVVIPAVTDTTARVRQDYLPVATQVSARMVSEATKRSAPYRAEIASRGMTTLAAVRGQITAQDVAVLNQHGTGRKMKIVSAAALVGAATGAGVLLWQRTHARPWESSEPAQPHATGLNTEPKAKLKTEASTHQPGSELRDDDPADPDGGSAESAARRHAKNHADLHSH
jgi:hypothetical protein